MALFAMQPAVAMTPETNVRGAALDQGLLVRVLGGELFGTAYSGFREGQHPDRGSGAVNPGDAEILEDLQILVAHPREGVRADP